MLSPRSLEAVSSAVRPVRVLAVMNAEEAARFFPQGIVCEEQSIELVSPDTTEELANACARLRPEILLCSWSTPSLPPEVVKAHGGSVAYACNVTGSVRQLVTRELVADGLLVSNWGRMIAPQVAEHALLLLLGALRHAPGWNSVLRSGKLSGRVALETRTLFGKTIALHGYGAIARELVRLLAPFAVTIRAYSAGVPKECFVQDGVIPADSLLELARGQDIFICCEALTGSTRGSIDQAVLSALNDGAVFCNVGRGAVVDEVALARAAESKQLRIASDVFADEPLSVESPLLRHERAFLSPHIGGPTQDASADCGAYALRNILRFQRGEPVESVVTIEVYDRST